MNEIVERRVIHAPKERVWDVLSDYGNIHAYIPSVKHSELEDGPAQGVGAVRTCSAAMGMKLREEVIDWQEGRSYTVAVDAPLPTKNHQTTIAVAELSPQSCELTMTVRYDTKAGILGDAMNVLMLRTVMRKMMVGFLKDFDTAATSKALTSHTLQIGQASP